jgi:broad specificity phosphatase PhoE
MPSIYLLRHAETAANANRAYCGHADSPLTPEGRKLVGTILLPKVDSVISSPSQRCVDTASILGYPDAPVSELLREIDFGSWEGKTFEEMDREAPHETRAYLSDPLAYRFPGGESFLSLRGRIDTFVSSALGELVDRGENVLVISHGGPLRMLVLALLGLETRHFWNIELLPGRISHIGYYDRSPSSMRLLQLNATIIGG